MRGFSALAQAATKPAALDKKTKELIAMALSVGARCDPCIGFHAETLVKLGTTRAELEDMLGMCVYMGGGPSLMYAAKALQAYEEFGGEGPKPSASAPAA
nr:carboxymuconolactone decarboxylase family protein [Sphaerotilus mobilis]